MPFFNKVVLMGHTTRLPDIINTKDGMLVGNCGIATNRKYKDKEETMFIDFTCFGKTAEYLGNYAPKGSTILIEGRLALDTWEQEGQKRSKHKIVVETLQIINSKKDNDKADVETDAKTAAKPGAISKKEDYNDDVGLYSD